MNRLLLVLSASFAALLGLFAVSAAPVGAQTGDGVVPISPCVAYDSTQAVGGFAGPLEGGQTVDTQLTGTLPAAQGGALDCQVPSGAGGVVVDITAVDPLRPGNLRAFPTGVPSTGGVVNFAPQSPTLDNSNAVMLPLSADGQLSIVVNAGGSTAATVDVRVTLIGYLDPSGLKYHPVTPCAVFDSRPSQGANSIWDGPFVGSQSRTIGVTNSFDIGQGGGEGNCGIPNSADAVFVNLVALNASGQGRLGTRAAGDTDTTTYVSYAGLMPTMNNANAVIVPLSAAGDLDVFSVAGPGNQANGRVVVLGYLDGDGDPFVALSPCAAFDSRQNTGAVGGLIGPFDGDEIVEYQIAGQLPASQGGGGSDCGVPLGASSVLMNLVAINPVREGNLRVNAVGTTPSGGVVNFAALDPAMNNSNAIAVPLSIDGRIEVGVNAGGPGAGQPDSPILRLLPCYFLDENRELTVEITSPTEGPIADRPTTISGAATDDVGVTGVDLQITDAVTGRFLALCQPGLYCWLSLTSPPLLATSLDDPGAIGTGFSFGPVDLDAGGSGSYRVTAIVRDVDGNTSEDAVAFRTTAVSPPSVTLTAPADGATVEGQAAIWVAASDDQGIVSVSAILQDVDSGLYLQQFGNGDQAWQAQAPTPIPLSQLPGTESWSALVRAPDSEGRTVRVANVTAADGGGSSNFVDPGVTFTIADDDIAPTVAIDVPTANQVLPRPLRLLGSAFDGAGVATVEILLQDANLGVYWNGSSFVSSPVWIDADLGAAVVADAAWSLDVDESIFDPFGSVNFFVTARATDVSGNQATTGQVLFSTVVDNQPPTVSLLDPSDGLLPPGPTSIGGSAFDNTGVAAVSVSVFDPSTGNYWAAPGWVDGEVPLSSILTAPSGPATQWNLELFVPNDGSGSGAYEVTVRAVDLAGQVTSITESMSIDEVGPMILFTSPVNDDELFDAATAKFTGEVSDPAGVVSVALEIRDVSGGPTRWWNGSGWSTSQTTVGATLDQPGDDEVEFSYSTPLVATSGEHNVQAIATDRFGNQSTSGAIDFFVDSASPTISFVGPSTGLVSPFTISVDAADDFDIDAVELQIEDAQTGFFFDGTGFGPAVMWMDVANETSLIVDPDGAGGSGSYEITARVTDKLAKTDVATRLYVTLDDTAPIASLTAPADASLVDEPTALVGTATDDRVVESVEVEVREWLCGSDYYNGAAFVSGPIDFDAVIDSGSGTGDVTWTAAVSLDAAGGCGTYRVRVRAFDAQGNGVFSSASFFDADTENPTVAITQPLTGTVSAPFDLFISATDDSPGVEIFYTIEDTGTGQYWDGDDLQSGFVELQFTGLVEIFAKGDVGSGEYKISTFAVDAVGNVSATDGLVITIAP